jgi:hypothetical protein
MVIILLSYFDTPKAYFTAMILQQDVALFCFRPAGVFAKTPEKLKKSFVS